MCLVCNNGFNVIFMLSRCRNELKRYYVRLEIDLANYEIDFNYYDN